MRRPPVRTQATLATAPRLAARRRTLALALASLLALAHAAHAARDTPAAAAGMSGAPASQALVRPIKAVVRGQKMMEGAGGRASLC